MPFLVEHQFHRCGGYCDWRARTGLISVYRDW
jgi:hypothetical protein